MNILLTSTPSEHSHSLTWVLAILIVREILNMFKRNKKPPAREKVTTVVSTVQETQESNCPGLKLGCAVQPLATIERLKFNSP